jgi:heptosyltransferase-2
VADRYFEAARGLDVVPDGGPAEVFTATVEEDAAAAFLASNHLGQSRGLMAVAPGAAHFTKRWPTEYWTALVQQLVARHDVIVLGGPGDREVATAIAAAGAGRAVSAAGEFTILGTAALLRRVRVVAAGDTGVLHLATAVGTPVVGLYGPTVEQFGFFPYQARAAVLQRDLPCRPCSPHGGPQCPLGHHHCLREILPGEVAAAMATPPR